MEFRDGVVYFTGDELDSLGLNCTDDWVKPFNESEIEGLFKGDVSIECIVKQIYNELLYGFSKSGLDIRSLVDNFHLIRVYAEDVRRLMFEMYRDEYQTPIVRAHIDIHFEDELTSIELFSDADDEFTFDDLLGDDFNGC